MENKINGFPTMITSQVVDALLHLPQDKTYEVTIKEMIKKRSLNANAYYWVLADKIARELSKNGTTTTARDVYRQHIHEIGAFEMVCMETRAVSDFKNIWELGGQGNQVEDMGISREHEGFSWVKVYKGSSHYNKEEMMQLINLCIQDAKELGIETMTPSQKLEMLSLWEKEK